MDVQNALPKALNRAVRRLLTPLFRLLLRQGMSFTAFEELAKRVYVEIALREFGIPGKKPSISRASILSGLTRKDVQRLLAEPLEALDDGGGERHNRAARVLKAWTSDPDFLDAQGEPLRLTPQDGEINFAALVRRHSGDMPVRAVLDELVRVGAVTRHDDGSIELVTRAFLPRRSAVDKLALLGTDVGDLVATIDHNIQFGDSDPRFQRKVMYRHMLASDVPEFKKLSAAQGMAVLQKLDGWLSARAEAAASPEFEGKPRVRLGLGIYYFEDHLDEAPQGKDD